MAHHLLSLLQIKFFHLSLRVQGRLMLILQILEVLLESYSMWIFSNEHVDYIPLLKILTSSYS